MEEKQGFFKRLVSGLTKTRDSIVLGMDSIFHGFSHIDEDFYEELEETLIMGDLGVHTTMEINIEDLREKVKAQHIKEPIQCPQLLIDSIKEQMDVGETAYEFERQAVRCICESGSMESARRQQSESWPENSVRNIKKVDPSRRRIRSVPAAGEQLKEWGRTVHRWR